VLLSRDDFYTMYKSINMKKNSRVFCVIMVEECNGATGYAWKYVYRLSRKFLYLTI